MPARLKARSLTCESALPAANVQQKCFRTKRGAKPAKVTLSSGLDHYPWYEAAKVSPAADSPHSRGPGAAPARAGRDVPSAMPPKCHVRRHCEDVSL
eukprot:206823-Prymnesium_polylepis.1